MAVYLVAVAALRSHRGRARIIAWAVNGTAVLVLGASFLPASLQVTAAVLAGLVLVLIISTRSRAPPPGSRWRLPRSALRYGFGPEWFSAKSSPSRTRRETSRMAT